MSKDPAFLFYTSDFLTGTMLMNNEQVGIYIRLLCVQHQHGGLIDKVSFNSMISNNEIIKTKFVEVEEGFYNKRLMDEIIKRSHKSSNLSANAKKRWNNQCKSNAIAYNLHMPIENENEDVNVIKDKRTTRLIKPTLEQVKEYCNERKSSIDPEVFYHLYESQGWIKTNGRPVINWKSTLVTWEKKLKLKMFDGKPQVKYVEELPKRKAPDPKQQEEVARLIRETAINL